MACMPRCNSNTCLRGAASNIVSPIRKLLRRVTFFHGDIESIDLVNQRVGLSHGHEEHCHSLPYDHLVRGLGSITNFFNLPDLAAYALTMKSRA